MLAAFRENAKEEEAARLRAQIELMTSQLQERDAAVAEWEAAMQEQKVRCVCVCVCGCLQKCMRGRLCLCSFEVCFSHIACVLVLLCV
ncbi:MAG: hypothetical protein P4L40_14715 [Terracidiphilus sp.]|nr:hypothetical protein [Terracidiphilus sp.]